MKSISAEILTPSEFEFLRRVKLLNSQGYDCLLTGREFRKRTAQKCVEMHLLVELTACPEDQPDIYKKGYALTPLGEKVLAYQERT
jgi:hypothetical protein